jgi:UDP-glucose 4-epimerase
MPRVRERQQIIRNVKSLFEHMRIFLTGGTGFIGSHFLRAALASGHEVLAVRRHGSKPRIPLEQEPSWLDCGLEELSADSMAGCETMVHLASPGVSPKQADLEELFFWNVTVLLKLLSCARVAGIRRIVIAGTGLEYGRSAWKYDYIPANAPLLPITAYAASKAAGCIAATSYASEHSLQLAYLRIFTAYGEGQYDKSLWPSLRQAAISGSDFRMTAGEQILDFVPVEIVAKHLVTALTQPAIEDGIPYVSNVGLGRPVLLRDFAAALWAEWGATGKLLLGALPYRKNEMMRLVPEVTL